MEAALFEAVKFGRIETIRILLSRGANVKAKNKEDNTLLHMAILKKDKELVKFFIDMGIDVNLKNREGQTALFFVFRDPWYLKPSKTIIKMLVKAGADVNIPNDNHLTVLHMAVIVGDPEIVQFLIDQGADVNAKDLDEYHTPLHYAADSIRTVDPVIFEILLSAGADVNARSSCSETALHLLSGITGKSLCRIVEVFARYGADFKAKHWDDRTPMDIAIYYSNTEAVEAFVLCGGVDVNSVFTPPSDWLPTGETILHGACCITDLPTVKFLLKNGADINSLDKFRITPLQRVVDTVNFHNARDGAQEISEKMELLRYLLKWNPDVNTVIFSGFNILTSRKKEFKLPDFLWRELVRHIAKLHAIGSPIHPSLYETISNDPGYKDYFGVCNSELELAKNCKLHPDSWVSLLNFLTDDKRRLFQYAGNEDLRNNFKRVNFADDFPIYGEKIVKKFTKAMAHRLVWEKAAIRLSDLLPVAVDPTHRVVRNILSFCKLVDVRKLVD